jgi:sterol desaturase/sphingolipid hydroxylase (fatty acid hydroxylase superfamily)
MHTLSIIVLLGLCLIFLERVFPDRVLTHVKGWWTRVIVINIMQFGIVLLGMFSWDVWFKSHQWYVLEGLPPFVLGFFGYVVITFVFYWWHRVRHDSYFLWVSFHQLHHSASRLETITSFYKHPLEIVVNSLLMGTLSYMLLGLNVEAVAWTILYSSMGEYIYHMNIKTPHWMGYFFQRPEMHKIHHKEGVHYNNFSDLPIWDMLFGTYENPKENRTDACGFSKQRETKFGKILGFKNVNTEYKKTKK